MGKIDKIDKHIFESLMPYDIFTEKRFCDLFKISEDTLCLFCKKNYNSTFWELRKHYKAKNLLNHIACFQQGLKKDTRGTLAIRVYEDDGILKPQNQINIQLTPDQIALQKTIAQDLNVEPETEEDD